MARHERAARPLFVISNDYGELGLAMYFMHGQAFRSAAAIALPDRLYPAHGDILPGATYHYRSVADLLGLAERHGANPVLLFSGYLLSNNRILSCDALAELVRGLEARGSVVVTTDPFLGLAPKLTRAEVSFDVTLTPAARTVLRSAEEEFHADLTRVSEILRPVVHLYHRVPDEFICAQASPSVGFFNPEPTDPPADPLEKRWLFVIGGEDADWARQSHVLMDESGDTWLERKRISSASNERATGARDTRSFIQVLVDLVQQTVAAGRRPTLVAPRSVVDSLPSETADGCDVVPFCPFPEFVGYVLRSEYVFYWNVFSASILPRLVRNLPLFFFDRGHMGRLIPRLHEEGVRMHFGSKEPTYLDPAEPLDEAGLAETWASRGLGNAPLLREWANACPSPQQVVERLMRDAVRAAEPTGAPTPRG